MSIYKGEKLISGSVSASAYPSPDWPKAVGLDIEGLYSKGYDVPSNGIIVGYFAANPGATATIKINNITVAHSTLSSGSNPTGFEGNVQCPVNKGDHITLETSNSTESYKLAGELYFVPYKAQ